MPPDCIFGWDIGGANVKVAKAINRESVSDILQLVCPLWKGLDQLQMVIKTIQDKFQLDKMFHCITMTGELVDFFNSRKDGVEKLVEQVTKEIQSENIFFYAGKHGFVNSTKALQIYQDVASVNWLASANYIASKMESALFIDIGSTTCDVIAIKDHEVICDGFSDSERLYSQELVYCGVVRTPIFALCKAAPVNEKFIPVINEYFSNSADVYRLTQELPDYADLYETLDGRDKDLNCSAARIARMFGCDYENKELAMWKDVAKYIREQQVQIIINACRKRLAKNSLNIETPLVGAGVGRFLIKEIAARFNRKYVDFESLVHHKGKNSLYGVADCAPAVSVACLGYQRYC